MTQPRQAGSSASAASPQNLWYNLVNTIWNKQNFNLNHFFRETNFYKKFPWNWFHEKYDWCKLLHSGTDAENGSYIYSTIHYIPASRLKSASTSTKLFASVRIKRPHKPQLTVNNLGLPGRYKSSSINQKKSFGKATRSKFFPINLWTILSYYLYMPMIFVSYSLV